MISKIQDFSMREGNLVVQSLEWEYPWTCVCGWPVMGVPHPVGFNRGVQLLASTVGSKERGTYPILPPVGFNGRHDHIYSESKFTTCLNPVGINGGHGQIHLRLVLTNMSDFLLT